MSGDPGDGGGGRWSLPGTWMLSIDTSSFLSLVSGSHCPNQWEEGRWGHTPVWGIGVFHCQHSRQQHHPRPFQTAFKSRERANSTRHIRKRQGSYLVFWNQLLFLLMSRTRVNLNRKWQKSKKLASEALTQRRVWINTRVTN